MPNIDVKFKARAAGVALWRIAKELGVSEMTINRRLRKEMTVEQKEVFMNAIKKIAAEMAREGMGE